MTAIRVDPEEISRATNLMFDAAEDVSAAIDAAPQSLDGGEITDALIQISMATVETANRLTVLTQSIAAVANQIIVEASVTEDDIINQLRPLIDAIDES